MIQAKCIQKFRDKNNHIYGYRLQDLNGQTQDVQPKNLKQAIASGKIHIVNLTLTTDGRLVDTTEKILKNKKVLGDTPKAIADEDKYIEIMDKTANSIYKALGIINGTSIANSVDNTQPNYNIDFRYEPIFYYGGVEAWLGITYYYESKEIYITVTGFEDDTDLYEIHGAFNKNSLTKLVKTFISHVKKNIGE